MTPQERRELETKFQSIMKDAHEALDLIRSNDDDLVDLSDIVEDMRDHVASAEEILNA